jgi:hypothetical protein
MISLGFIIVLVSPAVSLTLAKFFMYLYEKEKKKE